MHHIADMNTEQARFNMIEQQIRPWDVFNQRVLHLLANSRRELFVPEKYQALAFSDVEIPLDHQQCMMSPKVEARMLQALDIKPSDNILEIGTGSGFITSCLAQLGNSVYSIDLYPDFIESAGTKLGKTGLRNCKLEQRDFYQVVNKLFTYDVIALTSSTKEINQQLLSKLNIGGRAFMVAGDAPVMTAYLITRTSEQEYFRQSLFETNLTRTVGSPLVEEFVF